MVRCFILGFALISLTSPAPAQTARVHLPAINGVGFGSTFAAAQKKLGPAFKANTDPSNHKIKTLIGGPLNLNGASYYFNYRFGGADDRLTTVYALSLESHDFAICRANYANAMTGLTAQFGKPDKMSENIGSDTQFASATFKFTDGSAITPLLLGCILQISYERTPSSKK